MKPAKDLVLSPGDEFSVVAVNVIWLGASLKWRSQTWSMFAGPEERKPACSGRGFARQGDGKALFGQASQSCVHGLVTKPLGLCV